jgi:hypothetical protein
MLKNNPASTNATFWCYNGHVKYTSFITGQFFSLNLNPLYIHILRKKNRIAKEKQNLNLPSCCQFDPLSFYCPIQLKKWTSSKKFSRKRILSNILWKKLEVKSDLDQYSLKNRIFLPWKNRIFSHWWMFLWRYWVLVNLFVVFLGCQ